VGAARQAAGIERLRAAALARHYRDQEHLSVGEIADRLGRSPATISAYLYDPDGEKAKRVKRTYRGVCSACGAATGGAGPGKSRALCARCNGRATRIWETERIKAALRAWNAMYGRPASSTDLSRTHATRAALRDGGVRLRRLDAGWDGGAWPPSSVVQYHYGTVARANALALAGEASRAEGS
jgi:DNA-binding transcriptional ArsR family regulator